MKSYMPNTQNLKIDDFKNNYNLYKPVLDLSV